MELGRLDLAYEKQRAIGIRYKGAAVGRGTVDLVVEDQIVIELKAIRRILPVHRAQVVAYLKAMNLRIGLILNFKVPVMQEGVRRVVLHDSLR